MNKKEIVTDFEEVQRILKNEAELAYRRAVAEFYETENEEELDS